MVQCRALLPDTNHKFQHCASVASEKADNTPQYIYRCLPAAATEKPGECSATRRSRFEGATRAVNKRPTGRDVSGVFPSASLSHWSLITTNP